MSPWLVLILSLGICSSNCLDLVSEYDEEGESISLVKVGSNFVEISWAREGDWADVDEYIVEIFASEGNFTYDDDVDLYYNCTSENVTCNDDQCFFNSQDGCDNFTSCTAFDIFVEGNGTMSFLYNITSAPSSPQNVQVGVNLKTLNCSWEDPRVIIGASCYNGTVVTITTPEKTYSKYLKDKNTWQIDLSACDVGEILCSVVFQGGTDGVSEATETNVQYSAEDAGSLISSLNLSALPESLEASWSLEDECSRLTGYHIQWSEAETLIENATQVDNTSLVVTIGGLIPCTLYDVKVQPLMEYNTSLAKPSFKDASTTIKEPGAPEEVSCDEAFSGYSFTTTWKQPLKNNCTLSYLLQVTGTVLWSTEIQKRNFTAHSEEFNFKNLTPWTCYDVCISGVTQDGREGDCGCCQTNTTQEAPGAPDSFKAVDEDTFHVTLSWEAPTEKNGIIEGYSITWANGTNQRNFSAEENRTIINGLQSDTKYLFILQASTKGGKLGDHINLEVPTDVNVVLFVVLGVIGGILLAVLLALAFVYRRRITNFGIKMARVRSIRRTNTVGSGSSRFRRGTSTNSDSVTNQYGKFSSDAIQREDLREYIAELELDSQRGLEEEFMLLRHTSAYHSAKASKETFNKPKNRFINIFPYDHARVTLSETKDIPGSDYINASYIEDINGDRTFIASQGPKESTLDDFWRMIWELNCSNIVMLTNLMERGKEKCFKYWPDVEEGSLKSDDITIHNYSEDQEALHVIRHLEIELGQENRRKMTQYHFTAWPDFGVPQHEDQLLDFISIVRSHITRMDGTPIVVHCSAGVGRTGTFIGTWNLVDQINETNKKKTSDSMINLKGTVLAMRECRPLMVQAQEQYLYLCKCITAYIEQPQRWNMTLRRGEENAYDNPAYEDESSDSS